MIIAHSWLQPERRLRLERIQMHFVSIRKAIDIQIGDTFNILLPIHNRHAIRFGRLQEES